MKVWQRSLLGMLAAGGLLMGCTAGADLGTAVGAATRGAAYTTFDEELGGCSPGSQNGINCNHYVCQDRVYVTGGPNRSNGANTLEDGEYFFAILAPGRQNGGAQDGAVGNLSDTTAHGGSDLGGGDTWENRRFRIENGVLTNLGTHVDGETPNGQPAVRAAPFDETPNNGGVYILAICPVRNGEPTSDPRECKYDAFKTERCDEPPCRPHCPEGDYHCNQCPPPPCSDYCHEGDYSCNPCEPPPPPDCRTDCPLTYSGTGDCTPCPPECDPQCDPHGYASCVPCI